MAAAGVPLRTLMEWMGHEDFKTTLIYADYKPSAREADLIDAPFSPAVAEEPVGRRLRDRFDADAEINWSLGRGCAKCPRAPRSRR
jgi:hypothetical protein